MEYSVNTPEDYYICCEHMDIILGLWSAGQVLEVPKRALQPNPSSGYILVANPSLCLLVGEAETISNRLFAW